MEARRELELQQVAACPSGATNQTACDQPTQPTQPTQPKPAAKRVRGRRSSKPQMEKRRRARINECLDILKSYVLTEESQTTIDRENSNQIKQREESVARQILESSGLINRHRGRKNPNKLEKADILELTVGYVRRLHEQRDLLIRQDASAKLLHQHQQQASFLAPPKNPTFHHQSASSRCSSSSSSVTSPLSVSLASFAGPTPPTPPNSSNSSSPQPLLSISGNIQHQHYLSEQQQPQVLDLTRKPAARLDLQNCWRAWK